MPTYAQSSIWGGREDTQAWILGNNIETSFNQSRSSSPVDSVQASDQSFKEGPDASSRSSCSTGNDSHTFKGLPQLEGLCQIPEKHRLPGMARFLTPPTSDNNPASCINTCQDRDGGERHCPKALNDVSSLHSLGATAPSSHGIHHSRYSFNSSTSSSSPIEAPNLVPHKQTLISKDIKSPTEPTFPNNQNLTASVCGIRQVWAALEANRGVEKYQTNLELITSLSKRISIDGCTLFEYHISHLLESDNHVHRMKKLWLSLPAGQKTYWRKHSSKFQLPLAFDFWQLALRNLETDDHEERYSSMVRRAKRILEDASVDSEGHIVASQDWRRPVPERELQLSKFDEFSATRKIQKRLHNIRVSYGERTMILCRSLAPFIGGTGWTMFAYHGIPRCEEQDEMEVMAKLRAIWSGMTADDRLYWMEISGCLLRGLKCGDVDSLVYFSFDAWAVKEARGSAEAWGRLLA
ncbi:uncharacterized protein RCC_04056 [Ramularia collo-cygni]|uniref:Uncharacterized protein n=1 Tax=Ramularia collo-cygni TaxID=112498 RepID=A0A2D3UP71_9PEZI|nr:uncharacterized protein RCC_04056 [Ramularia collo-cygni]CZT18212.1 uncharacterized protein RCC_04056 [Ramularia collo-cygni]